MKAMKLVSTMLVAAMLAGCATSPRGIGAAYRPVIDVRPGQSAAQLEMDLAQCQAYANQIMDAQTAAMTGAIAGAVLGAVLGAAAGAGSRTYGRMAGAGAVLGGVQNGANAEGGQRGIVMRCMSGRGWNVLG